MLKSPIPTSGIFRLIWRVAPFINWAVGSIRWRLAGCWVVAYWFFNWDAERFFNFKNRAEVFKALWIVAREREFPRIKIDTWSPPIQVEVMQPVMGFKHNSEGQLEQTFKMDFLSYYSDGTKELIRGKPGGGKPAQVEPSTIFCKSDEIEKARAIVDETG